MTAIYISAALGQYEYAAAIGSRLLRHGFESNARWIKACSALDTFPVDPENDLTRSKLLVANMEDIEAASACVFLASRGNPRAAHWDAAYALHIGKRVVWLVSELGNGRCLWDAHPMVIRTLEGESDRLTAERIARALQR